MLHRSPGPLARVLSCLLALVLFAAACGGDDAPDEGAGATTDAAAEATNDNTGDDGDDDDGLITTDELFAPGDDPQDLNVKPPVDESFLVPVDELISTDLVVGDGDEAVTGSIVSVQYVGVLAEDGSQFDASWDRGAQPLEFALGIGQVITGWDAGVEGMRVGGRRVLQIPADQAYGTASPSAAIPANSDLVFIVDLLDVQPPPPPTPTPEPAPPVPEDALGSFDELGIIDLADGTGRAAQTGDIITVHYVGVNADSGIEFDSSWGRGQPFRMIAERGAVIEGWQQGLLGAQVGTERVLQIPSAQAYGEGDLVFRVHVLDIIEAPLAHTLTFTGSPPSEVLVETLTEGEGDGAEEGDIVNARIVVMRYSDNAILQSGYADENVAPLFVSAEGLLPGLNDAVIGIKPGEVRQIVLPIDVAFPAGPPPTAGAASGDALVFVLDVVDIGEFEG